MLTLFFMSMVAQDVYRLISTPFKIQDENKPKTFLAGVAQLESNGKDLFLLTVREPGVLQFSRDGQFIRRIGKTGQGPGELGNHRSGAFAVKGETVWVRSSNRLFLFQEGKYLHTVRIKSYQHAGSSAPSHSFSFSPDDLLVQVHPATRRLAAVYNMDGSIQKMIGELASQNPAYLQTNPALNFTLWTRDDDHYYCLFAYRPKVVVYNLEYEKIREWNITGPEITRLEEMFKRNEPDPNFTYPKPHFTDIKVYGDHLYLMCDGTLYQIDKVDGRTLSRSIFIGYEPIWKDRGKQSKLYYDHLAFLDDGTFFLSSGGEFYGAYLWRAELPFIAIGR
jgi:hypothetical protein